MKIMLSSLTYPLPNGVTASINTSVDGLLERGYEVKIVAPDYKKGRVRPEHIRIPSSLLIHKVAVNLLGKEERIFRVGAEKKVAEMAKEFNPDIYWLHSVTWAPNAFENHMQRSGKPTVLFYHTLVEEYGRIYGGKAGAYVMRKRTEALGNKVDAIMTPSNMMSKKLREYGVRTPVYVIPTGISMPKKHFKRRDLKERFGIPQRNKILLYVGRISKEKNLKVLLRAMEEIKGKGYKATLLLVGSGEVKDLQKEAEKRGIEEEVIFSGPLKRQEVKKIYGACDVFVFSSQTETQGLVVGEAMLAGLPVVALNSPVQEEIYPKKRAVVVEKEEDFAKKVIELLKDNRKRQKLGKSGQEYAQKRFSIERMIEKQIRVFKKVSCKKIKN